MLGNLGMTLGGRSLDARRSAHLLLMSGQAILRRAARMLARAKSGTQCFICWGVVFRPLPAVLQRARRSGAGFPAVVRLAWGSAGSPAGSKLAELPAPSSQPSHSVISNTVSPCAAPSSPHAISLRFFSTALFAQPDCSDLHSIDSVGPLTNCILTCLLQRPNLAARL